MSATEALAAGRRGRQQRETTEHAQAAELVDARRKRHRSSLADVIFKALCLVITGFFALVLGGFGVFLYLIG